MASLRLLDDVPSLEGTSHSFRRATLRIKALSSRPVHPHRRSTTSSGSPAGQGRKPATQVAIARYGEDNNALASNWLRMKTSTRKARPRIRSPLHLQLAKDETSTHLLFSPVSTPVNAPCSRQFQREIPRSIGRVPLSRDYS